MVYIYILKLENNKYYIGKTNNPINRLSQHTNNNGSEWTKKYKPIKLIELIEDCDNFDEDKYTKIYMQKYGIDNVRGGSYNQMILSNENIITIQKELDSSLNKCYNCGKTGHYIKDCKYKKSYKEEEYDEDEDEEYEIFECPYCKKEFDSKKGAQFHINIYCKKKPSNCKRCGRIGHNINNCYATINVKGIYLY